MKKFRKKDDKENAAGILIPAGLLFGMGVGFLFDNVAAGMFIGLGIGMALFALVILMKK